MKDKHAVSVATAIHRDVSGPDLPTLHRQRLAAEQSWFIAPPYGWRHPVTRRHELHPEPMLVNFGQYLKRARYFAALSQQQLADKSTVPQSEISRLERALAPSLGVDRLVKLGGALGRAMPLGFCPHEHFCPWQPAPPPRDEPPLLTERMARLLEEIALDKEAAHASADAGPAGGEDDVAA